MTKELKATLEDALSALQTASRLISDLEPDPEYREDYGMDEAETEIDNAIKQLEAELLKA